MPQRTDLAERKVVLIDQQQWPGLVRVNELNLKRPTIEVPGDGKVRKIQSGINTIPDLELTYKITRGSTILADMRSWYKNNETKTVLIKRVDAAGEVFAQTQFVDCECCDYFEPEFDAASPPYAQVRVVLVAAEVEFPPVQ